MFCLFILRCQNFNATNLQTNCNVTIIWLIFAITIDHHVTIPMKNLFPCLLGCLSFLNIAPCMSQNKFPDDVYQFIENPAVLELNQEPGHVPLVAYKNMDNALSQKRDASQGYLSLNGPWKFYYSENPATSPVGFYQPNFNDQKWGSIKV